MSILLHEGRALAAIHRRNNDKKYFCHFTGFLEGVVSSGHLEDGEIAPLLEECIEFVKQVADGDANDIIEDFSIDLLEYDTIDTAIEYRINEIDPNCDKSRLNRFLGYCRGISCDGVILQKEAMGIVDFLDEQPELMDIVGVHQIFTTCLDALDDGIISADESIEICEAIGFIVGDSYGDTGLVQTSGVANFTETKLSNFPNDLVGKNLVLTGRFKTSPRRGLEDRLSQLGAIITKSPSKKTDYILIGGEASRDWVELNRGTKIRKAQKLCSETGRPYFISESQLLRRFSD